ncbi:FCD domain-containing protein [Sphingomonas naphthae]|uniref:FCD domain-containing protein n=1 Tax=Sphingomonas naphthae TaxID=1813468 RepID=A0ABY7THZ2_9SPHN|nr:FCD domain-containing protein [Sphingomonas naphthae]WCT72800.1 FCD domain-containing protein [Sphingomonas naphthae]
MNGRAAADSRSLVQQAVDAVRAHIRAHDLKVGDTLPSEGDFAGELGVSRAVIREAFGALAALKLIDVANGRRARVGALDGAVMATSVDHAVATEQISVAEVWDVRRTVEVRIAALAAANRTDAQAAAILALAGAMAIDADHPARMIAHDIAFHDAIAEAAGNRLFTEIVKSFAPLMEIAVPQAWRTRTTPEQKRAMIERHEMLARAIAERDPERAGRAMNRHFDRSIDDLLTSDATLDFAATTG